MKIRASYGITGNNNIGDYAAIGIMENANYVLGTGTGNIVNGAAIKELQRRPDLGKDTPNRPRFRNLRFGQSSLPIFGSVLS